VAYEKKGLFMKLWWFGATSIGFVAAIVAAYVGIGGGVILTPLLLLFFEARGIDSPHLMQHIFATNMMFMVVSSSITSYRYRKLYPIDLSLIKWLLIGAAIGATGGGYLASYLPGNILKNIFGFVLILSSIRFLLPKKENESDTGIEIHPVLGLIGGLIAGGLAPLAGIGGGLIFVPILAMTYKLPVKQVPGYSHSAIVITAAISLAGFIWHGMGMQFEDYSLGYVNLAVAFLLILGGLPGIWAGIQLNRFSSPKIAKQVIGTFIFLMAIYVTFVK
jgi:uncharacterized membrane protein YfcA